MGNGTAYATLGVGESWEGDPLRLRHHGHRRTIRGHGYFKRLGPGIVTGAADQVGAAYGYGILWSTLFVAPMAVTVQEMAAVSAW